MNGFLFFDIDGTLVDSENGHTMPSDSSLQAVQQAQKNGYLCFIVSGRNYGGLKAYQNIGFDGIVFSDGAGIVLKDGTTYMQPIPKEVLKQYLKDVDAYNAEIILATKDNLYASRKQYEDLIESGKQAAKTEHISDQEILDAWGLRHLDEYTTEDVVESDISFFNEELEQHWLKNKSDELEYISTTASYGRGENTSGEVTYRGVTKGSGCEKIIEIFHGDIQTTYAFGDSMNDSSMFEVCKYGIAMGNAVEELKAKADYVTDSITCDGLRKALQHYKII